MYWVLIIVMYVNHHSVLTLLPLPTSTLYYTYEGLLHNGWTHTHGDFPTYNVRSFPPALPFLLPPSTHQPPYVKPLIIMIFLLQDGKTPFTIAIEKGHLDVVKTLIEAGANVDHIDEVGTVYMCTVVLLHKCTHCSALVSDVHDYGFVNLIRD